MSGFETRRQPERPSWTASVTDPSLSAQATASRWPAVSRAKVIAGEGQGPVFAGPGAGGSWAGIVRGKGDRGGGAVGWFDRRDRRAVASQPPRHDADHDRRALFRHRRDPLPVGGRREQPVAARTF